MKQARGAKHAAKGASKAQDAGSRRSASMVNKNLPSFAEAVIAWQKQHGRHTLPWQNTRDAYRIWLSEIMLQQTQVAAVIPYYERFLQRFPDVETLAAASPQEVMAYWSGLGYYSRARNLHRCAQRICEEYQGQFPYEPALLAELPGIGRSTAGAIAAFAYGMRAAILDGNVKRLFCRVFGIAGYPAEKPVETELWRHADALLPEREVEAYTQGLMDLGATVCTRNRPSCLTCPLVHTCIAYASGRVHELPTRKQKKAVPEKHAAMLVIIDGNEVLLEQRPSAGIWGGLLSLPELPHDAGKSSDARLHLILQTTALRFGAVAEFERLLAFTHAFTHYKLHVQPYLARIRNRTAFAGEGQYLWYPIDRLSQAPLPAPVKKLLLSLCAEPGLFSRND